MKVWVVVGTLLGLAVASVTPVEAQTTASGSAFGTILRLLDTTNLVDQSNTGTVTAPNASGTPSYDKTAAGATVPLAPVAEVVTRPSRLRGGASRPRRAATRFTISSVTAARSRPISAS